LVYGARTFREFREFVVEYAEPYYESLNALPKIVFSSTLHEPLGLVELDRNRGGRAGNVSSGIERASVRRS
jgi:hypothetical protein